MNELEPFTAQTFCTTSNVSLNFRGAGKSEHVAYDCGRHDCNHASVFTILYFILRQNSSI